MKKALIIIDMQNDYFQGGAMELENINEACENTHTLLEKFRKYGLDVFHIQHINTDKNSSFFIGGTHGAEIFHTLKPRYDEKTILKNYPNAFKETELLNLLQRRSLDHLVFCGAMSHMCVDTTVRAAFDFGFTCTLIDDACATKDLVYRDEVIKAKDVHNAFMSALSYPFAEVLSTDEFLRR